MNTASPTPRNIDEYIAGYPVDVQELLQRVRETIRKAAPDAEEKISYRLPTFFLKGNLVHFGAFTAHVGFYPTSTGILNFQEELSPYESSRGAVRFPFDRPIPLALITRIVKFRVKENLERAARKTKKT
jgi:uncharacterized protein YdhG (YjbR/CyaY superfamily)